jgi:hypothetical protein
VSSCAGVIPHHRPSLQQSKRVLEMLELCSDRISFVLFCVTWGLVVVMVTEDLPQAVFFYLTNVPLS